MRKPRRQSYGAMIQQEISPAEQNMPIQQDKFPHQQIQSHTAIQPTAGKTY